MERAISLAKLALGQVSPNPAVGAVIVKNDEVIGQGYTQPPGSSHAEIMALKEAGDQAKWRNNVCYPGTLLSLRTNPSLHKGHHQSRD